MTKKNLKPQQAAPVQREINTTSSEAGTGLTPQGYWEGWCVEGRDGGRCMQGDPFAGDDAE
ncbi:anacyclamide/piricyclamide family prenylated cyclic peptide [Planktothrix agardhii]|uniref:anacyclamide/piricyclamide family prenylated cyclic peptide n=1 Tax=Planktothrix agardhii TaxID=1160 RepID=UPI000412120D